MKSIIYEYFYKQFVVVLKCIQKFSQNIIISSSVWLDIRMTFRIESFFYFIDINTNKLFKVHSGLLECLKGCN